MQADVFILIGVAARGRAVARGVLTTGWLRDQSDFQGALLENICRSCAPLLASSASAPGCPVAPLFPAHRIDALPDASR
jgi:hypothetical protein